jgi:hypothetical protein
VTIRSYSHFYLHNFSGHARKISPKMEMFFRGKIFEKSPETPLFSEVPAITLKNFPHAKLAHRMDNRRGRAKIKKKKLTSCSHHVVNNFSPTLQRGKPVIFTIYGPKKISPHGGVLAEKFHSNRFHGG